MFFYTVEDWLKVVAPTWSRLTVLRLLSPLYLLTIQWLLWLTRGVAGNTWTCESMPTRDILHTYLLAVAISWISHHKSKVTL